MRTGNIIHKKKSDTVKINAHLIEETIKGYGLWTGETLGDGRKKLRFVPKSLVVNNGDGTFTMPVWLSEQEGF